MPRTGPLLALSRDHHGALVLGRDAKRAAATGNCAVWLDTIARVEDYWRRNMAAHCVEEERLIQLAREKLDAGAVARFLCEHAELRELAAGPSSLEPRARLSRFGELVTAHVRYEERVFFPQLEPHLPIVNAISNASSTSDPA
jgi:hemerythrin-like domain-containing protein